MFNERTRADKNGLSSPPPPLHPVKAPHPPRHLSSLGHNDKDDKSCQHDGGDQEAASKHQQCFVLEHPFADRARLVEAGGSARTRGVVRRETATSDDVPVDADGGFGLAMVLD